MYDKKKFLSVFCVHKYVIKHNWIINRIVVYLYAHPIISYLLLGLIFFSANNINNIFWINESANSAVRGETKTKGRLEEKHTGIEQDCNTY